MQRKTTKLVSSLLIVTILLSCFAVFSFAADGEGGNASSVELMINRSFDEGWDVSNGLTNSQKAQEIKIDYEQNPDFTYNYFVRLTSKNVETETDGHFAFNPGVQLTGGMVVEFDVKTDTVCDFTRLTYLLTTSSSSTRTYVSMFGVKGNSFNNLYGQTKSMADTKNQWVHVAYVYQFDQSFVHCTNSECKQYFDKDVTGKCPGCQGESFVCVLQTRTYCSNKENFDWRNALDLNNLPSGHVIDYSANTYYYDTYNDMKAGQAAQIYTMRFGFTDNTKPEMVGMSWCLDNLLVYKDAAPVDENGNPCEMRIVDDIADVDKYGYGKLVSESKSKTIPILGGAENKDYIGEGIVMKIGSNYALVKNQREAIFTNSETGKAYGCPVKIDGVVYVPFEIVLRSTGYPVYVHEDGITYDISTASGSSSLMIGRDSAVVNGVRTPLTAAPMIVASPDDKDSTYPVIAMDDVSKFFQGYYVDYDEMGVIAITESEDVYDRGEDLKYMLDIMKSFIFDYTSEEDMYAMIKENTNNFDHPYIMADEDTFKYMNDVYEGRVADETYKEWLDYYVAGADKQFAQYTTLPKNPANYTFKTYAYLKEDGKKYKYLAFEITNPWYGIKEGELYTDKPALGYDYAGEPDPDADGDGNPEYVGKRGSHYNDGYDYAGSRNSYPSTYAGKILQLALTYRITKDIKYAELAYDILVSLCDEDNWHNWAHKHFLTVGEMLSQLGPAYDWLYDVWKDEVAPERDEKYSLTNLTNTIYRKTIYYGYDISRYAKTSDVFTRDSTGYVNGVGTGIWNWSKTEINWNCVCSCGLVIGAMAIVGESQPDKLGAVYSDTKNDIGVDRVMWCMRNNLWNLANYGLVQYAPDGSYIESASYWSYATNYLADMLWAMDTAIGDDLGLKETWGLDKTFYFAIQVEFSETQHQGLNHYDTWAYHDSSGGGQNTSTFFYAAQFLNDIGLAAIRMDHIAHLGTGNVSWRDLVAYKAEYTDLTAADADLALDWALEACEGVVARSSWEEKSLFVGVMGGRNDCGNHGQMDSGIFTYVNEGIIWFPDLGSDEYNIYDYFGYGVRQHYYRMSTEGHNLVTITSLPEEMPFGQEYNGGGVIQDIYSQGEDGMYAIIDNSGAYGNITNYARRGMLLTNGRTTTVIQDEIAFKGVQSCAWIGHTTANITLSPDSKTAYLTKVVAGRTEFLRVTLLSSNSKLKFKIMTCGIGEDDFIFAATKRPGWSESHGQLAEKDRSGYKRLVIEATNTLVFDCAVVLETISKIDDEKPVQYKYTQMSKWTVSDKYEGVGGSGSEEKDPNTISNAKMTDIKNYTSQAAKLIDSGYAFSTRTVDFFRALARVTVAVNTYRPESFKNIPQINDAYKIYLTQMERYAAYREHMNDSAKYTVILGRGLSLI